MLESIRLQLKQIVGCRLTRAYRTLDLIGLNFGEERKKAIADVKQDESADECFYPFALHILCSMRVIQFGKIIVAADDMFLPAFPERQKDFSYGNDISSYDQEVQSFVGNNPNRIVTDVQLYSCGDVLIWFDDQSVLHVYQYTCDSEKEAWRFMSEDDFPCIVCTGNSIVFEHFVE